MEPSPGLQTTLGAAGSHAAKNGSTVQERIRLLLLDDHALFRESLAHLLASEAGFELVGECATAAEAFQFLRSSRVDIVLLDLHIGAERGDSFIAAARAAGYQGKFLIVTSELDAASSAVALKSGASGIFLESKSSSRLVQAIQLVANGEAWVDPQVVQLLADRYPQHEERPLDHLTDREQTVLSGILDGLTNKKIGDRIGASESSIKATLQQLFSKVGVRTRSQLVRAALAGSLERPNATPSR